MLDLNSADADTLVQRLNISPRLAKRIMALRPFRSVADLQKVWGISPESFSQIAPLVTVSPSASAPEPALPLTSSVSAPASTPVVEPVLAPTTFEPAQETFATPRAGLVDEEAARFLPARIVRKHAGLSTLVLIAILLAGAYFRLVGLNWDQNLHEHPDERFITMVAEQIRTVKSLAQYFDTQDSTLNPLPHGSYTYGMLPLFLTRYVAEWVNMTHYDLIVLVGRVLSGVFDLAVVVMLYLLGARLYSRRVGLLAAALSAAAVLPIQLSHYFTVDSFSTVFVVAGFYIAVLATPGLASRSVEKGEGRWWHSALFGLVTGLAAACKVNTLPLMGVIVLAGLARLTMVWPEPVKRRAVFRVIIRGWVIAIVVAAATFRVFQPYAFVGPGFFGLRFNQRWLDIMKEVTDQVAGKSEWPPNHHWTDRPVTYAWTNMVVWGMGIPLGLAAWLGWAWAAWRCLRGDWRQHLLPVVWVAGYFIWQNAQFWRYMRYFLPIYPFLILFAAWALVEVLDRTRAFRAGWKTLRLREVLPGALPVLILVGVIVTTYVYAFAFTRIYTRPHTRVAASRWILEHVPGPLNVVVQSPQGSRSYPVSVPLNTAILAGQTLTSRVRPVQSGTVTTITTGRMQLVGAEFRIRLTRDPDGRDTLAEGHLTLPAGDYAASQTIEFPEVNLEVGQIRFLFYTIHSNSPLTATRVTLQGQAELPLDLALTNLVSGDVEGKVEFTPGQTTRFNRLVIGDFQMTYVPIQTTLQVKLARDEAGQEVLAEATATTDFPPGAGGRSEAPTFSFSPVNLDAGTTYYVVYKVTAGGPVTLAGDTLTLETSWDDALPQRVDDYDPLGGLYEPLNLELYEPDTPAKRERMLDILAQANYIVIPSNRAYDAMPRLPLRYPMTLKYYQALFNCQCIGDDMEAQAYEAVPPLKGPLGFELVATFESRLNFGPISISDQTADESFTVYDHPKVLIFKKSSDFSLQNVRAILESVDLTQVVDQSPMAYTMMPGGLRLTPDRLAAQKAGGTWFEMFDAQSILNRNQTLGVLAWYLTLLLLGWLAFPLVFVALPGLADRGYPLVRLIVLLLMAWVTWLLSSLKLLPFTQAALGFSAGGVAAIGIFMAVRNRSELLTFVRARWRYLLGIEGLFLALFVFDLMVRLGNPDLWHPWLGGEKPMDLAFFDAILKTVYFPPPNPWFSGYYINYYYYGYVISAVLTKLLGIVPAIAYNLILPTWFAMTGVGAFCVTYNLVTGPNKPTTETVHKNPPTESLYVRAKPILAGVVVVVLMLFLGNLYQARQLWKYLPEVSAPGSMNLTWYQRAEEAFLGAQKVLSGQAALPGDKGRWYFGPSRPILHDGQDTPIAEFPYFSFLYGDLHPHLLAMPITFAALAWMLSVLFASTHKRRWLERIVMWFVAGLVFGVFYPAHTWDFPVWLGLGALAVCWSVWQARREVSRAMWLAMVGQVALLVGIAVAMYYPFRHWFGTSYSSFEVWKGARTPLDDYLTVHGLFLFILVTFLFWESRDWLKSKWTVLSSHPLGEWFARNNAWKLIYVGAVFAVLIVLWRGQYQVLVLALPLLAWIGFLLARQGQSLPKRIVLMALGVGIAITAVVEVVVLQGDVGRSNTVFKFYLQVWALFSVAASATLVELIPILRRWSVRWRRVWLAALFLLVLAAAMYPLIATGLKMADRWPDVAHPPRSLDGMAYMLGDGATQPAVYNDENRKLNLASDYVGIKWMQEHVVGTPTIVEGYTAEYRWGARYSIYTGLPTVVGWNWHVRQQNTVLPEWLVERRIEEVNDFYNTPDPTAALEFLRRYQVEYIVVGDLERAYYSANGLAKFQQMVEQGHLRDVFSKRDDSSWVTIYKTSSP